MNYWTKELLMHALPNAAFYNFDNDFSACGVKVSVANYEDDSIAMIRLQGELKGIPESYINSILPRTRAFITTNASALKQYNLPIIEVANPQKTVFALARYKRARFPGMVIDITGSAGKSTATRMCYDALCEYGASANLNQANTNFGISWNMTNYDQSDMFWINETSLGGGISMNSLLTMPNVAVVTNIAAVHLRADQDLINVAVEKSHIFDYIKPNGVAILYREMEFFDYVYEAAAKKVKDIITFGESEDADIRIIPGDINFIEVFSERYVYNEEPTPEHILLDAAIVAAVLYVARLPILSAFKKLNGFKALSGRGEVLQGMFTPHKKVTLVDESFNANPLSMKFALQGFNKIYGDRENKLLILGDMAEGGPETTHQHIELLRYIDDINPSRVLLCGKEIYNLWKIVRDKYASKHFVEVDDLIADLPNWIMRDDNILVKASHSVEFYKVVNFVKTHLD